MRKKICIILAGLIAVAAIVTGVVLLTRPQKTSGPDTTAFDLSTGSGSTPPSGWEVVSYENQYRAAFANGEATLSSELDDDLRLVFAYPVDSNTHYVLTAEARAEQVGGVRGAGLSIDNYAVDRSCVYSEKQLTGTTGWEPVELAFVTGKSQDTAYLALRLGGYGEAAHGEAHFRNVVVSRTDEAVVAFQTLTPWSGVSSAPEAEEGAVDEEYYKAFFSVILWAAVLCFVILYFGVYRSRERIQNSGISDAWVRYGFLIAVGVGLIVRVVLMAMYRGHDTDIGCFIGWGNDIAQNGTGAFYTAAGHDWYDYPPGYMLVLAGISKTLSLLGVGSYTLGGLFFYMLPPFVADVLCALLLWRVCRENEMPNGVTLTLLCLVVLNPAAVFLSGAWMQIDAILTLLLLCAFYLLGKEKRILAAVVYGVAILFKWQALVYGPVLAFAYLLSMRTWRDLVKTAVAVVAALAVVFLTGLLFQGDQPWHWLAGRFLSASGGYDYASVEAYNYLALCGGNWTSSSVGILGTGMSYKTFGTIAIVVAVLAGGVMLLHEERRRIQRSLPASANRGAVFLAAALCMCLIFTFGHYMHERYIFPVLFLLLFACAYYRDKRLLLVFVFLTTTTFLNEMTAMYVVSNAAMPVVRGQREHTEMIRLCSLLETVGCLYFLWVCIDLLYQVKGRLRELIRPLADEDEGEEDAV